MANSKLRHTVIPKPSREEKQSSLPIPLVCLLYVFPLRAPVLNILVRLDRQVAGLTLLLQACTFVSCITEAGGPPPHLCSTHLWPYLSHYWSCLPLTRQAPVIEIIRLDWHCTPPVRTIQRRPV